MNNVFLMIPTARGVTAQTVSCLFEIRTALERAGHRMHLAILERMPLDLARNELMTIFLSTTADTALCLDDDVQLAPEWVPKMLVALDNGIDIVTAPCRMRSEGHLFNVVPIAAPIELGGLRVAECAWTGLGAVMIARRVFEKLHADALRDDAELETSVDAVPMTYRSTVMPERTSAAIFRSRIAAARAFFIEAPEKDNVYLLDDRAFSMHAHEAGFKIHAAIDVPTCHSGLRGCFSEELEKLERSQARAAQAARPALLGADGKAL